MPETLLDAEMFMKSQTMDSLSLNSTFPRRRADLTHLPGQRCDVTNVSPPHFTNGGEGINHPVQSVRVCRGPGGDRTLSKSHRARWSRGLRDPTAFPHLVWVQRAPPRAFTESSALGLGPGIKRQCSSWGLLGFPERMLQTCL